MADVVSAWVAVVVAVVVVDEVVGEVVASVVVVVVGVSSRHEMRHSAPLAVFFLSDTNLNHWIKYQEGQHKALYLKVSLFSAVKFFGPFFWQNLKEEIHNDLSFNSKKEHFENQNLLKEYNLSSMHKQSSGTLA